MPPPASPPPIKAPTGPPTARPVTAPAAPAMPWPTPPMTRPMPLVEPAATLSRRVTSLVGPAGIMVSGRRLIGQHDRRQRGRGVQLVQLAVVGVGTGRIRGENVLPHVAVPHIADFVACRRTRRVIGNAVGLSDLHWQIREWLEWRRFVHWLALARASVRCRGCHGGSLLSCGPACPFEPGFAS